MRVEQKQAVSNNNGLERPTITVLPIELQSMVLSFLDNSDLRQARLCNRDFRACVKDITHASFIKQCTLILEQIQPYLLHHQQVVLQELLMQIQQGVQIVAGISLAFDMKNARTIFRQELIRYLAGSAAPIGVEHNSLYRENFLSLLPQDFEKLISLISFIRDVRLVQNDFNLSYSDRCHRYENLIDRDFFKQDFPSDNFIRDAVCLLDVEVSRHLVKRLLNEDHPLAFELVQMLPEAVQNGVISDTIISHGRNWQFSEAISMIHYLKDPLHKDSIISQIVEELGLANQIESAIDLIQDFTEDWRKEQSLRSIGKILSKGVVNNVYLSVKVSCMIKILNPYIKKLNLLDLDSLYAGFSEEFSLRTKTYMGTIALKNKDFVLSMLVTIDTEIDRDIKSNLRADIAKEFFKDLPQDVEEAYQSIEQFLASIWNAKSMRDCFLVRSFELDKDELALKLLQQRRIKGHSRIKKTEESLKYYLKKATEYYMGIGDFKMMLAFSNYIDNDAMDYLREKLILRVFTQVDVLQERVSFEDRWARAVTLCFPQLSIEEIESLHLKDKLKNQLMETLRFKDIADIVEGAEKVLYQQLDAIVPMHLRTQSFKAFIDQFHKEAPKINRQYLSDEYQTIEPLVKEALLAYKFF